MADPIGQVQEFQNRISEKIMILTQRDKGQIYCECALRMIAELNLEFYDIEPVRAEYEIVRRIHDLGFFDAMR